MFLGACLKNNEFRVVTVLPELAVIMESFASGHCVGVTDESRF